MSAHLIQGCLAPWHELGARLVTADGQRSGRTEQRTGEPAEHRDLVRVRVKAEDESGEGYDSEGWGEGVKARARARVRVGGDREGVCASHTAHEGSNGDGAGTLPWRGGYRVGCRPGVQDLDSGPDSGWASGTARLPTSKAVQAGGRSSHLHTRARVGEGMRAHARAS